MTDPESLFRQEALEHHRRPDGPGGLLDLDRRWVTVLYWALLGLVAVGVAVGAGISADGRRLLEVLFR